MVTQATLAMLSTQTWEWRSSLEPTLGVMALTITTTHTSSQAHACSSSRAQHSRLGILAKLLGDIKQKRVVYHVTVHTVLTGIGPKHAGLDQACMEACNWLDQPLWEVTASTVAPIADDRVSSFLLAPAAVPGHLFFFG
jgi:hypothetical protein